MFALRFRNLLLALCGMALFTSAGSAQEPPPNTQDEHQPIETLKVNVDVVNVYCNVKDKHGALIPALKKEDFRLQEDGKPQTIKYFGAETDQPLTLGLLIDTSGSQQRVLPMEKEAGSQFLGQVLRSKDEAFLISFDVDVNLEQDFTSSTSRLRSAMEQTKINTGGGGGGAPGLGQGPFPTVGAPRGTLLYDAIYLAADEKLGREVGRKAMIILTDGEDQGSKKKIRDAVETAQKADSIVYVILIADRGFYGGGYHGDSEMRQLTEDTGGRMIDVGNKFEKLRQAFDQIANELRTQYLLGYTPTNPKKDGTFRKIEIRAANSDYKVQARRGYYAMQQR